MIDKIKELIEELQRGRAGLADEAVRTEGGIQALQLLLDRVNEPAAAADAPAPAPAESADGDAVQ